MSEEVITDTGPLIHLDEIEQIVLLQKIFSKIYTTNLIQEEIIKYNIILKHLLYQLKYWKLI
jgi:predicted nucleic acid-binding protein